jgi:hypothetical protein
MLPTDDYLVGLLHRSRLMQLSEGDLLIEWWIAEQNECEELVCFLVRKGVLIPEASKTVVLGRKGFVKIPDLHDYLTRWGCNERKPSDPSQPPRRSP